MALLFQPFHVHHVHAVSNLLAQILIGFLLMVEVDYLALPIQPAKWLLFVYGIE